MAVMSMVNIQKKYLPCRPGASFLPTSSFLSRIHTKATGAGSLQRIYRKHDHHLWGRPQRATALTYWDRKYMLGPVHHSSCTAIGGPLVFDRDPVVG